MEYDKLDRLVKKMYADGTSESYKYDAVGNIVEQTAISGAKTTYTYDMLNRNTSVTDAYGNTTKFGYDMCSRLTEVTDALDNTTYYQYDDNGNVIKTTYPDGNSVTSEYDARNRVISQTDQNGYVTEYVYDGADRLTSVKDAYGSIYSYIYDSNGNLIDIKDAKNNVTSYGYDESGRVIQVKNAAGMSMEYKYDEAGNVTEFKDYAGNITAYEYDGMDRITVKTVGGETTIYAYNEKGLLKDVTDNNGIISYQYDSYNRLVSKKDLKGITLTYAYDDAGRLKTFNNGFGNTTYEYDRLDRLTRVIDHNGRATVYEYDELGNRKAVRYPNGCVMTYTYDSCQRLKEEYLVDKNGEMLSKYSYGIGKAGERTSATEINAGIKTEKTYVYDKLYRLVKEKIERGDNSLINEYTYDEVSNRISKTTTVEGELSEIADINTDGITIVQGTTTYGYNSLNQLVTETLPDGKTDYSYDDAGNLVSQSGVKNVKYSYDKENRLTDVENHSGDTVIKESYTYDYEGNRVSKCVNNTEKVYYVTDTSKELSQVAAEVNETCGLNVFYTRGQELISMEKDNKASYYLYDGNGNVTAISDDESRVTDRYAYDAYGNLLEKQGNTENEFLYSGEQYNANTGLYYLRSRYMNPDTGSFINMDSYAGNINDPVSLHKYLYANANPIMYKDPSGNYAIIGLAASMGTYLTIEQQEMAYNAAIMSIGLKAISALITLTAIYNTTTAIHEYVETFELDYAIEQSVDDIVADVKAKVESSSKSKYANYVVYTLVDKTDNPKVRYVGRTNDYDRRMTEHERPGGKMNEYNLDRGGKIEGLTKEEARGIEQTLIVLYHTLNNTKDLSKGVYNFVNGVGINGKNRVKYYNAALEHMNKYPTMYENFVEEELNAIKEDMGNWW